MASNRNLKSDDVDGFMLAVWDSFKDLERGYKVGIQITLNARERRGELAFQAIATQERDGVPGFVVATAEALWPTHYAKAPHSLLYALLVRLWRELDVWVEQQGDEDSED